MSMAPQEERRHIPVLSHKLLTYVALYNDGIYVDATVGLGGHAEAILDHAGPNSRLIGIDRDHNALAISKERLSRFGRRVTLMQGSFGDLRRHLNNAGVEKVHAIYFDLGVSSLQLDTAERGFSFLREGPLDMRMDQTRGVTAADLVNTLSEYELRQLLFLNAQERYAPRIARAIISARSKKRIATTSDLVSIITSTVPPVYHRGKINPATRTFQALRMEVNKEMQELQQTLAEICESLLEQGRLGVISFHSMEDRMVKDYMINQSRGCVCSDKIPLCVCGKMPTMKIITKKALVASDEEMILNPRARSARLRVAEKIA